jgi:hypothetical protein
MGIGGCCCADVPCCGKRLFQGVGGVQELTLSLESRQTWEIVGASTACDPTSYHFPYGSLPIGEPETRILTAADVTLTYEEIPAVFLADIVGQEWQSITPEVDHVGGTSNPCSLSSGSEGSSPTQGFFEPSEGWYVSPSMTFYQVPGDNIWTGTKSPITGKYFLARIYKWQNASPNTWPDCLTATPVKVFDRCVFGFWFDADQSFGGELFGDPAAIDCYRASWFARNPRYKEIQNGVVNSGTADFYPLQRSPNGASGYTTNGLGSIIVYPVIGSGSGAYYMARGVFLTGVYLLGSSSESCNPVIGECGGPSVGDWGCPKKALGDFPSRVGLWSSPFRGAEILTYGPCTETNYYDTDCAAVSETPPVNIAALLTSYIVSEIFYLHYTVSE